jgi:hydrogenase 3 maturation protease
MDGLDALKEKLMGSVCVVIVGVGNEMKADDGVGILITERLRQRLRLKERLRARQRRKESICILDGGTTPENLTGTIKKIRPSHILLLDAAQMGKGPGEVAVLDPKNIEGVNFSTHSFSISDFAGYLKREIGAETVILGVQPKSVEFGADMSKEVRGTADTIINALKKQFID